MLGLVLELVLYCHAVLAGQPAGDNGKQLAAHGEAYRWIMMSGGLSEITGETAPRSYTGRWMLEYERTAEKLAASLPVMNRIHRTRPGHLPRGYGDRGQ